MLGKYKAEIACRVIPDGPARGAADERIYSDSEWPRNEIHAPLFHDWRSACAAASSSGSVAAAALATDIDWVTVLTTGREYTHAFFQY